MTNDTTQTPRPATAQLDTNGSRSFDGQDQRGGDGRLGENGERRENLSAVRDAQDSQGEAALQRWELDGGRMTFAVSRHPLSWPPTPSQSHRIVVTGGAGFLGSHLCDALVTRGDAVVCVDNLSTGTLDNIAHLTRNRRFRFIEADVSDALDVHGQVDVVAHLASPASPPDYLRRPLETLAVGSRGTENALRLAHRSGARFVLASTSEVYGDPVQHPQREDYWGNVNPVGPRSVYDEAKRYAEALTMAYRRHHGVDTGIFRIFNTYGPRMRPEDGRVVSSFITQALNEQPLTIYGDGTQTRSFCYVDDLVRGIVAMIDSTEPGPINLGNPVERTVSELAELVVELTGTASRPDYHPLPTDDPTRRRPDISAAASRLDWRPEVSIEIGLERTIAWFRPQDTRLAAEALVGGQLEGQPLTAVATNLAS